MKRYKLMLFFIFVFKFFDSFASDETNNNPRVAARTVTEVFKEIEQQQQIERKENAKKTQSEIAEKVRFQNGLATQVFEGAGNHGGAIIFNEQSFLDNKINFLTEIEQSLPALLVKLQDEQRILNRIKEKKKVYIFLQHTNMLTHDNDHDRLVAEVAKKNKAIDNAGEDYCCCWPRYKEEVRDFRKEACVDKYIKQSQTTLNSRLQNLQNQIVFDGSSESTLIHENDRS